MYRFIHTFTHVHMHVVVVGLSFETKIGSGLPLSSEAGSLVADQSYTGPAHPAAATAGEGHFRGERSLRAVFPSGSLFL